MKLFFCTDGILRLYADEHTPMLPCTFLQSEMDMEGEDFAFFSRFLDKEATFEKGLTFQGFIRCLSPWTDFWSMYSQINLSSYLNFVNRPYLAKKESYIDSLEFSTFVNVESGLAYIFENKLVRSEDIGFITNNFAEKFDPTLALGASFNIENMYYLRGYNEQVEHFSFDICNTPLYEYMYASLTLRKRTNIIFNEEGSKSLLELQGKSGKLQPKSKSLIFSKSFPGSQRLVTGDYFEDDSYSYVEGDHLFSLEEIMREFFRFMPPEAITTNNQYSDTIHQAFDMIEEYKGKVSKEVLSEMIGNALEDLWDKQIQDFEENSGNEISQTNEIKENLDTKVMSLNHHNKVIKENTFDKLPAKDNKVLSLQDFREKKEHQQNHFEDAPITPMNEDHEVLLLMVEQAKLQNIPLKEPFGIEQNHQPENRVLGILQEPVFETFDPIKFINEEGKE